MSESHADDGAANQDALYEVAEGIATITLNRPDHMNTLGGSMLALVSDYLYQAEKDPEVRVIILTGNGRAFCAGLDVVGAASRTGSSSGSNERARVPVNLDTKSFTPAVIFNCDKPVICAMNGAAAGFGMDMALACDIRIMAKSARMAPTPVKRGIVPESGGTWLLPRLVGWEKASEIFFTARNLGADESKELGLCAHVVADEKLTSFSRELAGSIAANAPLAVQSAKRLMRMGHAEQFDHHVHHVYMNFLQLMRTEDAREGMVSFAEKRDAEFKGH
ncbi:MAG: enoyl-CoA hydratase/isomerase family protein [Gammaproteobacteria bacterium]|nr:enoyl-CoA hydratase/isomerase family protein [Gammaproteobacteria bacterium]